MEKRKLHPTEEIQIGNKYFYVEIADTLEKRMEGLSTCSGLKKGLGMLFIHEDVEDGYYTMEKTDIDLDIIFINEEGEVIQVNSVKARDPKPIECDGFKFVLETLINSGVLLGDELNIEDEEDEETDETDPKQSKMLVLDSDGDVQMKLYGGERIVSMIKTRQFIKAALKAYKTDADSDYRRVGRIILNELDNLDSRPKSYVGEDS